jgi:hypothetical protein
MSSQSIRKRLARPVRRLLRWSYTPYWLDPVLRRLAHRIHPHVLRCRSCDAEFIASDAMSTAHAGAAYKHFVANHDVEPEPQALELDVEECRGCAGPVLIAELTEEDDLPLCNRHWSQWLARFLNSDDAPGCSAHLIREPHDSGEPTS